MLVAWNHKGLITQGILNKWILKVVVKAVHSSTYRQINTQRETNSHFIMKTV